MIKNIVFVFVLMIVFMAAGWHYWLQRAEDAVTQSIAHCNVTDENEKINCWEDLVRDSVKTQGISGAFDLIYVLSEQDKTFSSTCHSLVHIIGQAAYRQFRADGAVSLSDKTAVCAFGFYHGFMEMLIARKGAIEEARAFCKHVEDTLTDVGPGATYGCYHGIGHGSADIHNPVYFGNEREIVRLALATCEKFSVDDHQLKLCATGVFDSIALAYYSGGENGLVMKKEDPLWLCRHQQDVRYKEACYLDMMPAVIWLGGHDLTQAVPIIFSHAEKAYTLVAVRTLAENSIRFLNEGDRSLLSYLAYCHTLEDAYRIACIEGLGVGVMQFGTAGREYVDGFAFCQRKDLWTDEVSACIEGVLGYVQTKYSPSKAKVICESLPEYHKEYCDEI